jgi:N-acetylneuraminic acid mutarotase
MKFKTLTIIAVALATIFTSCNDDEVSLVGNWVQQSVYEGYARAEGSGFAIGNNGYYGMGRDDDGFLTDFWKFDPTKGIGEWTKVDSFPGTPRAYNVSISNGKKGYVGLGYDGTNDLSDFWEYDADTDSWKQIADYPGGKRRYATAFAIGDDIYVGTGTMEKDKVFTNDFYKYDGTSWAPISSFPDYKCRKANAVGFNGKGYLISGFRSNVMQGFWSYDPTNDSWTSLTKLNDEEKGNSAIARQNASVFAANGKIYITGGNQGTLTTATTFEWNPTADEWKQKTDFEGGAHEGAGVFVLNDKGYIVGGRTGNSYKDDTYVFYPDADKVSND